MKHSLEEAVADGTITEAAAFCGLGPYEIKALLRGGYAHAKILVRYRNARRGDWRAIINVIDFPGAILGIGTLDDVRDVFPAVMTSENFHDCKGAS